MYQNSTHHIPKASCTENPCPRRTGGEGKGREMGEVESVREGRAGRDTDTAHAHSLRPMNNP